MEGNIKIDIQLRKEELYGRFRSMKFKFCNNLKKTVSLPSDHSPKKVLCYE